MFVVLGILFLDMTGVTGYFWPAPAGPRSPRRSSI